jgi:hypothetical protein
MTVSEFCTRVSDMHGRSLPRPNLPCQLPVGLTDILVHVPG